VQIDYRNLVIVNAGYSHMIESASIDGSGIEYFFDDLDGQSEVQFTDAKDQ
jgi:hypothetical protein